MMIDTAITTFTHHPFQVLSLGFFLVQLVRNALASPTPWDKGQLVERPFEAPAARQAA